MHKYIVNGEQHWANSSDPQIPTALTGAVAGVLTLHNFIKKPAIQFSGQPIPAKVVRGKKPQVTFPGQNGQPSINVLAPQDDAVIYNINPVYAGAVYGSPAIIGVIGRSNLYNSGQDVQIFWQRLAMATTALAGQQWGLCSTAQTLVTWVAVKRRKRRWIRPGRVRSLQPPGSPGGLRDHEYD
jgi:hypothetical protein